MMSGSRVTADVPVDALRECRALTRRQARNFYYGLRLLPEPQRSALFAIYAWMRAADDIADGANHDDRLAELEAFRAATDAVLMGNAPAGELWSAFGYVVNRFELPPGPFHAMLEGQLDDLRNRRYHTFDDLADYCRKVASTVGVICIEIWGYSDPEARDLAVDRGIAFQLTNIIRDFAADFDDGRTYLPTEDFAAAGLEPADVRRWSDPDACHAFMSKQIERAETYFSRSEPLDALVTPSCRPTLRAMTGIYRQLLHKAARDPARLVEGRLSLSRMAKARIALQARWR